VPRNLAFSDLWVTENTIDQNTCFDPVVILTYAAAVTSRIRVGASVVVLPTHSPLTVAHQWATLDFASGGRAILAVGLGREHHYRDFQIPVAARVKRFREEVELIKALWSQDTVTIAVSFIRSKTYRWVAARAKAAPTAVDGRRPSQRRPSRGANRRWLDGVGRFEYRGVQSLGADPETRLEKAGRDPASFPISKRVFMAASTSVPRSLAPNSIAGSRRFTTTQTEPMDPVSTAPRNTSPNGWRNWSLPAQITCCSTRSHAFPSNWRPWRN
jgi:alkanesulfonate monooxygenase SsuD/methylene tetrahydromethanopterin reductase-like flavin-dependent oxidoreductase (luciferase family)